MLRITWENKDRGLKTDQVVYSTFYFIFHWDINSFLVINHRNSSQCVVFVSPWHVLVSVEMVKPEGQAQENPPMMLLHE